ncbi:inositol monophosphatase family protein [Bacillus sp. FJAT-42376]|uniref:inositol monophosphatase family protein n=1 Tax=Bacillus sp. FJAT-42376 TaxID=2014076 RepID=UPI000F4F0003|nr:inositol monophosphatase family protein [Bacillus sp. FJAT-42376]AZB42782.1 inositol monophosphatase family protein [Bacillus sp. FJAT-42376]
MTNWKEIDLKAKTWVKEAGERIRRSFKSSLSIQTKSNPNDLVTNMDKETEQFFISKINQTYPDHRILGEEGYGHKIEDSQGVIWIIDPIDGTMNFVHQQRNFAISIGIYEDGIGMIGLIYDVVHDELYHAIKGEGAFMDEIPLPKLEKREVKEAIIGLNATWVTENRRIDPSVLAPLVRNARGTRSYGSAALEFAYVVSGRLDCYITMRLAPWDFAAGLVLLEEVGGKATTVEGEPISMIEQNSILAAREGLHEEVLNSYLKKG